MCRLLGVVSHSPLSLAAAVHRVTRDQADLGDLVRPGDPVEVAGQAALDRFTELSRRHGHGWGLAWDTGGWIEVAKAPEAAYASRRWARSRSPRARPPIPASSSPTNATSTASARA